MENVSHRKAYVGTFAVLLVLLVATVGAAYIDLGRFGLFVAMSIAIIKAVFVTLYFMHVRWEGSIIKLFAAAGWYWLLIALLFTFADYATR